MLTTARPLAASSIEQSNEPKLREAAKPAKHQPATIHPSLRALPDYPE